MMTVAKDMFDLAIRNARIARWAVPEDPFNFRILGVFMGRRERNCFR